MTDSMEVRWYQREIPRPLAILVVLSSVALLVAVIISLQPRRRPDRAGWDHLAWQSLPGLNGAAIFAAKLKRRSLEVTFRSVAFHPKDFDLVVLDNGPSRATPHFTGLRDAMERRGCIAGVNGGFFDPATFRPNGQVISDGERASEYDPKNWARGVVFVQAGELVLRDVESFDHSGEITQLLQTGPWLVRDGLKIGRYENDYPAPRTFLAEGRSGTWMLGQSSAITLEDLSQMLGGTTFGRVLTGPTRNAVNLDGGPSSGFWAAVRGGGEMHSPEQTIVRNYIGLRPKLNPVLQEKVQ